MPTRKLNSGLGAAQFNTGDIAVDNFLRAIPLFTTRIDKVEVTFDPASVAAATTVTQSVSVTGVSTTDIVLIQKPTTDAGILVQAIAVPTAKDTVDVTFANVTAGAIDPGSETYTFIIIKV